MPSKTLWSLLQCCLAPLHLQEITQAKHTRISRGFQTRINFRLNFGSDTISLYVKGGFMLKATFLNTNEQVVLSSPPPPTNF